MHKSDLELLLNAAGATGDLKAMATSLLPLFANCPDGFLFTSTAVTARVILCNLLITPVVNKQLHFPIAESEPATVEINRHGEQLNQLSTYLKQQYSVIDKTKPFHPTFCIKGNDRISDLAIDGFARLAFESGGSFKRSHQKDGSEKITVTLFTPFKLNSSNSVRL